MSTIYVAEYNGRTSSQYLNTSQVLFHQDHVQVLDTESNQEVVVN